MPPFSCGDPVCLITAHTKCWRRKTCSVMTKTCARLPSAKADSVGRQRFNRGACRSGMSRLCPKLGDRHQPAACIGGFVSGSTAVSAEKHGSPRNNEAPHGGGQPRFPRLP